MGKRQRDRKQQSRDEQQRAPAPESDQYEVILSDSLRAQLGGEAAVVGAKRGRGPADDAQRHHEEVQDALHDDVVRAETEVADHDGLPVRRRVLRTEEF